MQLTFAGGFYVSRGIIANAQRCVNLYPEKNPSGAPAPISLYLTPGSALLRGPDVAFGPISGVARGGYFATNGSFYTVVGQSLYFVDPTFQYFLVGVLEDLATMPVSMVDNGICMVLVDGSSNGYAIELSSNNFAKIAPGTGWLGADFVDYLDTFLLFNRPGTTQWYASLSNVDYNDLVFPGRPQDGNITPGAGYTNGTYLAQALTGGVGTGATADITVAGGIVTALSLNNAGAGYKTGNVLSAALPAGSGFTFTLSSISVAFDPTYIAAKTGFPDKIAALIVMHREIWLLGGMKTSEIWYDAGAAAFPFQIIPGIFLEHGVYAPYSVKKFDLAIFFLGIDAAGTLTVFKGEGYKITPISTFAVAQELSRYVNPSDAIGMIYKQQDHAFYVLTFPTANKTWVYDITQDFWHERTYTDANGGENRIRWNWVSQAYGKIVAADWETGALYEVKLDRYDDNGAPVVRRRGFDHLINDGKRVVYDSFIADIQCGEADLALASGDDQMFLRWSDDRGRTFGQPVGRSLGLQGQYLVQPKWSQLGMARDRVFEIFWSCPVDTSCDGAFLQLTPSNT